MILLEECSIRRTSSSYTAEYETENILADPAQRFGRGQDRYEKVRWGHFKLNSFHATLLAAAAAL